MDRTVEGTLRRPDHRRCSTCSASESHDLVIETDENSHWFYLCADERDKEAAVHFWLNRQEPSRSSFSASPRRGTTTRSRASALTSCWGMGPVGCRASSPPTTAEWAARLKKLAQVVEAYLVDYPTRGAALAEADRPKPELHAIELFYDDVARKKNAAAQGL